MMMTCRLLCALLVLALCCCSSVCVTEAQPQAATSSQTTTTTTTTKPPTTTRTATLRRQPDKTTNHDHLQHRHQALRYRGAACRPTRTVTSSRNRRQPQQLCVGVCPAGARCIRRWAYATVG
ncbi:putative mucin TcMUCI [Trypanosoma cruzi]|nr:putative mucin TcMUCI [Trypanosoma cruzi]